MVRASVALLLGGCAHSTTDTATVCIGDPDAREAAVLGADGPVTLAVTATGGCHMADFAVTCAVTRTGDDLVVSTETSWVNREPLSFNCESVLLWARGACSTPDLPAGTYTLRYGADEVVLDVPGTALACVDGDPGSAPPLRPDTGP